MLKRMRVLWQLGSQKIHYRRVKRDQGDKPAAIAPQTAATVSHVPSSPPDDAGEDSSWIDAVGASS